MIKIYYGIILLMLISATASRGQSDSLSLSYCYEQAENLSPLKQQELLNRQVYDLSMKNHSSNYLPSLFLSGKATYQSDVFNIPGTSMISDIPQLPKDQYQVSVNIQQNIYDGGLTQYSKRSEESKLNVAEKELDTRLYDIHETINSLYFSYVLLQENLKILNSTLENLRNQHATISSLVENGAVLKSNLFIIEKQIASVEQDIISLRSDKNAVGAMLSDWTGVTVNENTILEIPDARLLKEQPAMKRPEIGLFQAQKELLNSQAGMTNSAITPRISAFAQAGIGRPNPMNFFEVEPSTFYIAGLQLNWQIFDWGNTSRKKQIFKAQQDIVNSKQEDFTRNISIALSRQFADQDKLNSLLEKDDEIISLQEKIVESTYAELKNGVITSTEYLTEMNALTQAKIKKIQHKIQLSRNYVSIYTLTGNKL